MHHSSMSWEITPLYFFSWNCIYFQEKEPNKVQIWWNFTWAVESLKFCTMMGSFCSNHIKLSLMTLKSGAKFKENQTCGFKYEEFVKFSMGSCSPKYAKFEPTKIQGSYLSWHWTVMQNLNKPWLCGFKTGTRNCVNFH